MRLCEFDLTDSPQTKVAKRLATRGANRDFPPKVIGKGNFGAAVSQPQHTNSILKVGRFFANDESRDGYFEFIKRIRDLHNPYFPQIDLVKKYGGGLKYKVRMERLTDLSHLSVDELFAMFEKILGYEPTIQISKDTPAEEYEGKIMFWFTRQIEKMMANKIQVPDSADPNFKEAMKVLKTMSEEGWGDDIHSGNMMIRRSPYGFQLVFLDPFTHLPDWNAITG